MGVNFFQPIVVERLRKDGNLRQDKEIPHFNEDGSLKEEGLPQTWRPVTDTTTSAIKPLGEKASDDPFE